MGGVGGVRTFVFTDVEGSTERWDDEPEAMAVALEVHDDLLDSVVSERGGQVVKHTGDGLMAVFVHPADAIAATVEAQRALAGVAWPTSVPIRVRMGVHTGAATERDGDFFGVEVSRAARIMDAAHGAQVLVSASTWSVAAPDLASDVSEKPLGPHRLKGLRDPEDLHQVSASGLESSFRTLRTMHLVAHNLPTERAPLIGRDEELRQIVGALGAGRVVTLTGPGGVGKSRLARAAGHDRLGRRPDGVFVVGVGAIRERDRLVDGVAAALDMPTGGSPVDRDSLLAYAGSLSALVVLDDAEHLAADVAALVDDLVRTAPDLFVLVTSRESLGLASELVVRIEPLDTTADDGPAVRLFLERAEAAGAPTSDTDAVRALCRRLDGLPLAIELAAGNAAHFEPHEILAQLDAGAPLAPDRRATGGRWSSLDETLAWSNDLLDDPHRAVLRSLSVFNGTVTAARAAAVLGSEDVTTVARQLADLAAASMVDRRRTEGGTAYVMLGVVRDFARDQARRAGESPTLAARHRDRFLAEGEATSWPVRCGSTRHALRCEVDLDDHRAAMAWSVAEGRNDLVLRELVALCGVWWVLPHAVEGRERLAAALAGPCDGELMAAGLLAQAATAVGGDDFRQTRVLLAAATEATVGRGYPFEPLLHAVRGVSQMGRLDVGLALLEEARAVDPRGEWTQFVDHFEGDLHLMHGDAASARDAYDRALTRYDWDEYLWWATAALSCQSAAHHLAGENDEAIALGRAAVDLAEREPTLLSATARAVVVAYPLAERGDFDAATELLRACVREAWTQRHLEAALGEPLGGVAALALRRGDLDVAGVLLGIVEREAISFRSPWQFALHVHYVHEFRAGGRRWPDESLDVSSGLQLADDYLSGTL